MKLYWAWAAAVQLKLVIYLSQTRPDLVFVLGLKKNKSKLNCMDLGSDEEARDLLLNIAELLSQK